MTTTSRPETHPSTHRMAQVPEDAITRIGP